MLYIFTGNGKGKTTAALGQAMRAIGEGKKVLMVQFIKGPWKSGEDFSALRLNPDFKLIKMGLGFVGIMGDTLPREEHEKAAVAALEYVKNELKSGAWDMVILDEVNNAVSLGLISAGEVVRAVSPANPTVQKSPHLIFTGRDAPHEFLERADLVTEMREIIHPYGKGIQGKRGLEY